MSVQQLHMSSLSKKLLNRATSAMDNISHKTLLLCSVTVCEHSFSKQSWSFDFDLLLLGGGEWKGANKRLNKNVEVKKFLLCSCRSVSPSTHYFLHMHACV